MRSGFWLLALLWLPVAIAATAAVRFADGPPAGADLAAAILSLAPVTVCGLPLALACRRLGRLGYGRAAWTAGAAVGALTAIASLFAGLLGPLAIAVSAVLLSLPVWAAAIWLGRRS